MAGSDKTEQDWLVYDCHILAPGKRASFCSFHKNQDAKLHYKQSAAIKFSSGAKFKKYDTMTRCLSSPSCCGSKRPKSLSHSIHPTLLKKRHMAPLVVWSGCFSSQQLDGRRINHFSFKLAIHQPRNIVGSDRSSLCCSAPFYV